MIDEGNECIKKELSDTVDNILIETAPKVIDNSESTRKVEDSVETAERVLAKENDNTRVEGTEHLDGEHSLSGSTRGIPDEETVARPQGVVTKPPNVNGTLKENSYVNKNLNMLRKASEKLQCPFYWQDDLHIKTYGDHDIDLLTDFEDMFQETSFKFRR